MPNILSLRIFRRDFYLSFALFLAIFCACYKCGIDATLGDGDSAQYNIFEATIKAGDSLHSVLRGHGVSASNISALTKAINTKRSAHSLKVGNTVLAVVDKKGGEVEKLELRRLGEALVVEKSGNFYKANLVQRSVDKQIIKIAGVMKKESSIQQIGRELGATHGVLTSFEKLYSSAINMRAIAPGSRFEILFERFFNPDGTFSHDGKIVYAALDAGKENRKLYLLKNSGGVEHYYTEGGSPWNYLPFVSPLRVRAKVTSKYGMRKHPITGKWKMHKGVDLAAPGGTKVFASANAVVAFVGYNNGYGNYIKLDHGGGRYTLYAHLRGFATGLKVGHRIKQGEHIGYVGTTGMSTGNHLHYELIEKTKDGRLKNSDPMRVVWDSSPAPEQRDTKIFDKKINEINILVNSAPYAVNLE